MLCVSLVVIVLDNTILNVALPTLAKIKSEGGLGASASQLQWIVDSYVLVFAGLLLTAGSLGDRFGRYKALAFGLTVFGIGSAASAFAGSANVLIATRSLMGIGGAFIMPSTLSILTNVFTNPQERGKAIGVWAGVSAVGLGIGPISGGLLLAHFWWGSVFLVNLPIVVLGLVCGYYLVPESQDPAAPKLDPFGAVLSIAAIAALLWAIIEAPSHGWTSGDVLAGFAVGVALLVAFLAWELNYSSPMLDLHFFENPRFSAASSAITITFFAMFGTLFLMTQYLQLVLGYSTVKAGAILLPQAATIMVAAPFSSVWVRRFGNKVVMSTGLLIVRPVVRTHRHARRVVRQPAGDPVHDGDGSGHGQRDGAGHRLDHGLVAASQGRRRLGRQRHDPTVRRRDGRGRVRIDPRIAVRRPPRLPTVRQDPRALARPGEGVGRKRAQHRSRRARGQAVCAATRPGRP